MQNGIENKMKKEKIAGIRITKYKFYPIPLISILSASSRAAVVGNQRMYLTEKCFIKMKDTSIGMKVEPQKAIT